MEPSKETKDKWHQDPSNWIWGIFYFNKEDKRILPPKRIKQLGWTINFANPNSVFFLLILLVVIYILSKYH
ncbi:MULTISPECIES: DUF5808 domain-containing protein [unclassified Flavobacterium]|uniref:DUF5808 domain-containing protein n=1 Tax=unclassified Flavobacterium TaxID=196869 RepID=UPI00057E2157|nr:MULTISPECIES: DUF5808 domain-containing protein [unclassified Flavobacterium]KIA97412.1 hypothetical protein OA93_14220 [Flavobacterium sp. KMS]KIC01208.1 hypothetical protein OA88_15295 [Flavobacterium sp. JRM]MEA9414828.1 DUF5808 domain-containing protein [Flavobacterium sp. PL02]